LSYLHLVEAIGERKRKNHTRARSLASPLLAGPGRAGPGGAEPMGAHARHAREWSGDFPLQPLRVRGFLLLLESFACMEEIALAYLVSNYFCIMASA